MRLIENWQLKSTSGWACDNAKTGAKAIVLAEDCNDFGEEFLQKRLIIYFLQKSRRSGLRS